MKGFLQEYGVIMVVVAVVLGMLAFGKTGYAKSIQDAILGSADHIVETGENITKKEINVKTGDVLEIDGTKYIVIRYEKNNKPLVMSLENIKSVAFQPTSRSDGQNQSTYEGSDIDNYLEGTWYKNLSKKMQGAIKLTNIKQVSYFNTSLNAKQDTGPNGQIYNPITRHVFLPSIEDLSEIVNLNDSTRIKKFTNKEDVWSRDSFARGDYFAMYLDSNYGWLSSYTVCGNLGTRPTFVIDLSKVDYTEAGHVDYK